MYYRLYGIVTTMCHNCPLTPGTTTKPVVKRMSVWTAAEETPTEWTVIHRIMSPTLSPLPSCLPPSLSPSYSLLLSTSYSLLLSTSYSLLPLLLFPALLSSLHSSSPSYILSPPSPPLPLLLSPPSPPLPPTSPTSTLVHACVRACVCVNMDGG